MGEQPSLWAKLKLHFEDVPHLRLWDPEEEEEKEEDPEEPLLHQVLTVIHLDFALQCLLHLDIALQHLLILLRQVLTLRRLQSLESLSLSLSYGEQPVHLLQTVVDHCPKLPKLSVDFDVWDLTEAELAQVAEILVKFQEIDLTEDFIPHGNERARVILMAILRALPGESSKLKILTLHGDKKNHTAALAEARDAGVTVNMETNIDGDSKSPPLTDSDDNSGIDDDDDDDF